MKHVVKPLGWTAGILLVLALAGGLFTETSTLTMLSLALGFFSYFILPGYSVLLFLKLDDLERILLAVPASVAIVPTALYFANVFGLPLSRTMVIGVIVLVTLVSWVVFRARTQSRRSE